MAKPKHPAPPKPVPEWDPDSGKPITDAQKEQARREVREWLKPTPRPKP